MEKPDFMREPPALPPEVVDRERVPPPPGPTKVALLLLLGAAAQLVLWLGQSWAELTSGGKVCCLFELSSIALLGAGAFRIRAQPGRDRPFRRGMILLAVQAGLLFAFETTMLAGGPGALNPKSTGSIMAVLSLVLAVASRFLGPVLAIPAASNGRRTLVLWLAQIWGVLTFFAMFGLTR
jgi:hypothetical protein